MTKTLITFCASLLFATFAQASQVRPYIVGGEQAGPGEFPFIASLQSSTSYSSHFCGGSLIKPNWVLTAAHCVKGGHIAKIYIGALDQKDLGHAESFTAARIVANPKYDENTMDWDYALIKLSGDSTFRPVELNTAEITIPDSQNPNQVIATTAGWGVTNESSWSLPDDLMKVQVPLVNSAECLKSYDNITDRMVCAGYHDGGKDSCQGDSGGPLVVKNNNGDYSLAGVVSWGEGCARPEKYGVYSKVNAAIDWINETTKN